MQELMSRHKAYALSPRDCLKTTLFQKWQRMVAPPETQRPPNKRRKRKSSATNAASGGTNVGKKKNNAANMSPGPPNFSLASQVCFTRCLSLCIKSELHFLGCYGCWRTFFDGRRVW